MYYIYLSYWNFNKTLKFFNFKIEWGNSLLAEHESFLVEKHFNNTPVTVTGYPKYKGFLFVSLSSMFAGSDSIDVLTFEESYNFPYISIITAMLVTVIIFYGIKYIYKLIGEIFPVIFAIIHEAIVLLLIDSSNETVSFFKL